ncbi:MAG TPA: DUF6144 family protein [Methanomassiliicoccales archaeon]|nr:DUF6144 family protein [Methanomassiliicoccales archaeon]
MTETDYRILEELDISVRRHVGERVRRNVMKGLEDLTPTSDPGRFAEWVRGAMARLDDLVDERTRSSIMHECGRNCSLEYRNLIRCAKERYQGHADLNEFLASEKEIMVGGVSIHREGDVLYHIYTPSAFAEPSRCYCSLLRDLPRQVSVSRTYCECSRGFIQSYWEQVLEAPVEVEIQESVISGGKECRFAIRLPLGL